MGNCKQFPINNDQITFPDFIFNRLRNQFLNRNLSKEILINR